MHVLKGFEALEHLLAAIFMFAILLGAADVVNAPLTKWSKMDCSRLFWWILQNNLVSFWTAALIYIACLHAYISTHLWFKPGSERRTQYRSHHVRRVHFLKKRKCVSLDESIHRMKEELIHRACFSRLNENVLYPSSQVVHCEIYQRNANIGNRCTGLFSSAVIRNDPILKDPRRWDGPIVFTREKPCHPARDSCRIL